MSELEARRTGDLDPWMRDQLALFHAETADKLALAPVDSKPVHHSAGGLCRVDEDGWPEDYDDQDADDAVVSEVVDIEPLQVTDTETRECGCGPWITLAMCGSGGTFTVPEGRLVAVKCPSIGCGHVPVVDGCIGPHRTHLPGPCPWVGVRVVDTRPVNLVRAYRRDRDRGKR